MGKICMKMTPYAEGLGEGIWVNYIWKWPQCRRTRKRHVGGRKCIKGPVLKDSEKVLGRPWICVWVIMLCAEITPHS